MDVAAVDHLLRCPASPIPQKGLSVSGAPTGALQLTYRRYVHRERGSPNIYDFIGWIGLWPIGFDSHFTPAIEVGWRLLPEFWAQGYATEGAEASLQYGFDILKLDEIVSITVPANVRSKRVMEKLGMHTDPKDDFDHPKLRGGHPLKRHVLYRLERSEWQKRVDMP